MLQVIREKVTGWFAAVIIGLLTIPFALWGINNYFTGQVDTQVALVNDHPITSREFQNRYRQYQQRLKEQFQNALGPEYFEQPAIKRQFLQSLIEEALLMELAVRHNLRVSPQELADFIASYPAFQVDGRFNAEVYKSLLRQQGLTPRRFEQQVESSILLSRIPQAVSRSAFFVDHELQQLAALLKQQRDVEFVLLQADIQDDSLEITEEEVQQWYESHPQNFMQPEAVQIQYLEVRADRLAQDEPVDEALLRQRYEQQKARFVVPERRKVSHILLELPEDADQALVKAVEQKMAEIRALLDQGADFAELARAHSQDPGSSEQGGDLGWVEPGSMVPEFEQAVNRLDRPGQISEPVRTPFGLHLIRLDQYESEHGQSFEEARAELEREYREELAEKAYLEMADKVVEMAFEDPNSLDPAAEAAGLQLQTSEFFSRDGGPGIATHREVVQAAFSHAVREEGQNSDAIELGDNHMVVLRVIETRPEQVHPLEEVREQVVRQVKMDKARQKLAERRQTVEAALAEGRSLEAVLQQVGASLKRLEGVTRTDNPKADPGVVAHIFRQAGKVMEQPRCDALGASRVLCYRITAVTPGSVEALPLEERQQMEQQLVQGWVNAELQALLARLEADADIVILEDQL